MTTGTLITTPFGFETTAAEVVAGVDLTGKRAIVTGGASGIGVETARALAAAGADVTLAVRDTAAGDRTAADLTRHHGPRRPRRPARPRRPRLDRRLRRGLDRPAAHPRQQRGRDGRARSPRPRPRAGTSSSPPTTSATSPSPPGCTPPSPPPDGARVVSVSSAAHLRSPVIFDDLHFAFRPYDPWLAYGQSKTANVLFAVEADRRWADDGIRVNALMPGGIATNLQRHIGPELIENARRNGARLKTPEQGAATSVLLAASPLVEGVGGRYFEDVNEAAVVDRRPAETLAPAPGVARYALDPANAERLWSVSEELVG